MRLLLAADDAKADAAGLAMRRRRAMPLRIARGASPREVVLIQEHLDFRRADWRGRGALAAAGARLRLAAVRRSM